MNDEEDFTYFDLLKFANDLILRDIKNPIITDKKNTPTFIQLLEENLLNLKRQNLLLLPNLHKYNETISIFSDYGGESADSKYQTYSFLFAGYDNLQFCFNEIRNIRIKYKLIEPYKEINFKSTKYGPIKRCLDEWLYMANFIPGLLFTLAIDKELPSIFGRNKQTLKQMSETLSQYEFGKWKPKVAEKIERILHLICYWIGVLSVENQKLLWITDDDSIVANKGKLEDMKKLFSSILSKYNTKRKFPTIGITTPFNEKNLEFPIDDLLSIPDLTAGSIESYFTKSARYGSSPIKEEAIKVLMWLSHQGIGLKKLTMTIELQDDIMQTKIIEFKFDEQSNQFKYVPIYDP